MKTVVKWLAGSIFVILVITLGWRMLSQDDAYKMRQVKAVATSNNHHILDFYPHISQSKRPRDPYSFPIPLGAVGPNTNLYSGPNQYPFFCMTLDSGLGPPEVDNHDGDGVSVYDPQQKLLGYSKDCGVKSRIEYYTIDTPLVPRKLTDNEDVSGFSGPLFRVEQGTINRFIYTIIVPITPLDIPHRNTSSLWNKRLIYQFNGGSGIGYRQGRQTAWKVMKRQAQQLLDGYAIISSSGNKTSYTYNMLLAEDTARRVKKQFVSLYGEPLYTVGIGGSGGGLAQYLIAQNSTGILDGLLPLYSYPDMITQTTYALDCDLLNNYFTFRADDKKIWRNWDRRRLIEGMNAINDFPQRAGFLQPLNQLMAGFVPTFPEGNSECINGYFGLSAFINNPKQGFLRAFFADSVVENTNWSYWQDMQHILGKDQQGFGRSTWDNMGVQYGLNALNSGEISFDDFIDINHNIGSWKPQNDMAQEQIVTPFGTNLPLWLSLWGNENITEPAPAAPAARHQGNIEAMHAAYRSGQVFIGNITLPIIDARHYLENELDMHHMSASFYSRLRINKALGHTQNHIIWVAHKDHDPTQAAFAMMDKWLLAITEHTPEGILNAKPNELQDTCFDSDGKVHASGSTVFNGKWNNQKEGACQSRFPMFSTSRIESGAPWAGDIFKCHLMSINSAIDKGIYAAHNMTVDMRARLQATFPHGVCNYDVPDMGRPKDI
ncbi:DUF6351 family protein [Pseudoalteromonas sp. MMG005]|uniref:DUF6351 family protein n=1 Tax=Pseudoalteromonas sp. MMG005 TaxID=2822682 RepID=UPI001B3A7596|nr:DUF6351 family protein [Pseudoalteromonas sp. MMG005]MBQ4845421.1 hypothetical protein [Pseudoalteromonas sp. MMG005]